MFYIHFKQLMCLKREVQVPTLGTILLVMYTVYIVNFLSLGIKCYVLKLLTPKSGDKKYEYGYNFKTPSEHEKTQNP